MSTNNLKLAVDIDIKAFKLAKSVFYPIAF